MVVSVLVITQTQFYRPAHLLAAEELATAGPFRYTLEETGEFTFACKIHCDGGQRITVIVADATAAPTPAAKVPSPAAKSPSPATIGQVVDGLCPDIKAALAGPDLSALFGSLVCILKMRCIYMLQSNPFH